MNRAVFSSLSGALAALDRLDAVAQNLANVNTVGYKGTRVVFEVRPPEETSPGTHDPIVRDTSAQVVEAGTVRDFTQGPVRASGNPLDVAVTGDGFFVVATARGERYTRQGNFTLDRDGYLVTAAGDRVQGDGGDIRIGSGEVTIGTDGAVTVDGAQVGRVKLVGFGDHPNLVPEGASLYAPGPNEAPVAIPAEQVSLQPEAIEGANVDAVSSMIELVDVTRGFETYMRAVERLDQLAARAINEVGRV
ncbi:MAG TPA: flagellar basal-body rod protein FlgF [Candidatus Binatia bacterium]|nr:flagellar basal-body rod protein FlgF [Candidatus Binatia bacterium]